jgi:excisionase family DNA binding protein
MPTLMTLNEVADALHVSAETVRHWRKNGRGPRSLKIGRRVMFTREDVEAFIDQARRNGVGDAA